MMKNKLSHALLIIFCALANFIYAIPVTPPTPAGAPGGGNTGDADIATTPIDMYMLPLIFIAVLGILYFAKKHSSKIA